MAVPHMMTELNEDAFVGVRFLHEAYLSFAYVEPGSVTPATGEWVIVSAEGDERLSQVVAGPHQFVLAEMADDLPVLVRRATEDDVTRLSGSKSPDEPANSGEIQRLGGPGFPVGGIHISPSTSSEDARYQELKARFPALGEVVATPEGEGLVVAINMRKSTVDLRLQGESDVRTFDADALILDASKSNTRNI